MSLTLGTSIPSISGYDDDPWSAFAYFDQTLDGDHLDERASTSAAGSTQSSPANIFSSHEPTIATKPTSNGTDYIQYNHRYRKEAEFTYATSLCATYGSASEEEIEHDDPLHATLLGTGGWVSSHHVQDQCLRRRENTKIRLSKDLPRRLKKPTIVLHQSDHVSTNDEQEFERHLDPVPISEPKGTVLTCAKSSSSDCLQSINAFFVAYHCSTILCLYWFA